MSDEELVTTTVKLLPVNVDKAFLSAASLNETPSEVINRAIAFYHAITEARPGQVIKWRFADGSEGRVKRLRGRRRS